MTRSYYNNFLIDHYQEVGSTNSLALQLAKSLQINHNHIILSDAQTNGRGRLGRNWESPLGNLYFSLALKPTTSTNFSQLSFVAAIALSAAIQHFNDQSLISHKWPNDILLDGKKIAGILLEKDFDVVIIGIGVNINSHPNNTSYAACNLIDEGFMISDKISLLKEFLDNFSVFYQKWLDFGFVPIRNLWLDKAFNLNKEINVNLPNQSLKGIFKDLDQDGNLILETNNGLIKIASGEVFI